MCNNITLEQEYKIAKEKLNIIKQICEEEADSLAVYDLQKRIKVILNE